MRGVAVGDALGWPWERPDRVIGEPQPDGRFYRWRRRAGNRFWSYEEALPAGTYSDDTQLMLCVARALLAPDWFEHLVGRELPTWRLYERGGGGAVLRAAKSWTDGRAPWTGPTKNVAQYFGAGANGVAMRIAPHVAVGGDEVLARVVADGVTTHGHPRALIGATLHAWTLAWACGIETLEAPGDAIRLAAAASGEWGAADLLDPLPTSWKEAAGDGYPESWSAAREETVRLLELAAQRVDDGAVTAEASVLDELGATDRATNGAGHVCAVAALFLATRYAAHPEQAIQSAARQPGADTDTLAAMTAALAGAMSGLEALGPFPGVQDEDYITRLAEQLAGLPEPPVRGAIIDRLDEKPAKLTDTFPPAGAADDTDVTLPDGRAARVVQTRVLSDPRKPNQVTGIWLRTDDGQGLVAISRQKVDVKPSTDASATEAAHDDSAQSQATRSAKAGTPPDAQPEQSLDGAVSVELIVETAEPRDVIDGLRKLGLTGRTSGDGWRVHGLPVVIQGVDTTSSDGTGDKSERSEVTMAVNRLTLRASAADRSSETVDTPPAQLTLEVD